jgi:hypothetical protein
MGFLKQASLRWSPAFRQQILCWSSRFAIQVSEYLADYRRVFNTGNDPDVSATLVPALCHTEVVSVPLLAERRD